MSNRDERKRRFAALSEEARDLLAAYCWYIGDLVDDLPEAGDVALGELRVYFERHDASDDGFNLVTHELERRRCA